MQAAVLVLKEAIMARTVPLRVWKPHISAEQDRHQLDELTEPPLKPSQPNQISTVPRKTSVVLWGLLLLFSPMFFLFPRTSAYASALHPDAMWTGPPPA